MPGRMNARAFCPGHLTGLFVIRDEDEKPEKKGSLGAGLCLSRGAMSMVNLSVGTEEYKIFINGVEEDAPVTRAALGHLMDGAGMDITVRTTLELPVGQGLGMSGAGALSSCLAICRIMGLPSEEAVTAAHLAEVENGTGLGDVVAQAKGGLEVRRRPGLEPHGLVENHPVESKVFLCVMEREISTASILKDPEMRKTINDAGVKWFGKLKDAELRTLMETSFNFAKDSGLMNKDEEELCRQLWDGGHMASLSMLGNTIFCIPGDSDPTPILTKKGRVFELEVENKPARIFG